MQLQTETKVINKRRLIGKMSVIFLMAIVLLTFLSRTIEGFLMPKVSVTYYTRGSLHDNFNVEGTIEFLGRQKVVSGGVWKVKAIDVAVAQQVKKGDPLAQIDYSDILYSLKSMDMEILSLEDDLANFRSDYEITMLPSLQRDVGLAKKAVDDAEKNLNEARSLYENTLRTKDDLDSANKEYQDKVYDYTVKQSALKTKKEEYERGLVEKNAAIGLKRLKYEKTKREIPPDGIIRSDWDGTVTSINIESGSIMTAGQDIIDIIADNSPFRISWYLDTEKVAKFDIGSKVTIEMTGEAIRSHNKNGNGDQDENGSQDENENQDESGNQDENGDQNQGVVKTVNADGYITGKEYSADTDRFKIWTDITGEEVKKLGIVVKEGQKAEIFGNRNSQDYDFILPKSCIFEDMNGECIFVLVDSKTALGTVKTVEKQSVDIAGSDEFNVALANGVFVDSGQIVQDTTKPLSDGMRVRVR